MIGIQASAVGQSWTGSNGGGQVHEGMGHESAQFGRESSQNREVGEASTCGQDPTRRVQGGPGRSSRSR